MFISLWSDRANLVQTQAHLNQQFADGCWWTCGRPAASWKPLLPFALLLALCALPAWGQGTCPAGANYWNSSGTEKVTLSSLGVSSCYYFSSNGSNSNAGTTESSPCLYLPGMVNAPSSGSCHITPAAGEGFIIEGGSAYHFGNSAATPYVGAMAGWTFPVNGSSGSPIYIGVDQNWYAGGSWTDIVLNGDNPLWNGTSAPPSSCTYDYGSAPSTLVTLGEYNIWDGFEITGVCNSYAPSSSPGNPGMLAPASLGVLSSFFSNRTCAAPNPNRWQAKI